MLGNETASGRMIEEAPAAAATPDGAPPPYAGLLQAFFAASPAMQLASLSYVDGRPLATIGEASPEQAQRVAAMASSFLALSETFARETSHGRCSYATITSVQGLIVAVRVPSPRPLYVLSAAASRSDNLAMVLRRTLDCAEALAAVLP